MRKFLLTFIAIAFAICSFGSATISEPLATKTVPNASEILIPIGTTGKTVSLLDLSRMSRQELETATGKKMKFFERLAFKRAQKKLHDGISDDGTITNKKFKKLYNEKGGETGFHLGGFALGFFLSLIGVLIAYLINDDYKANRVKWAWIGMGVYVLIYLIVILALI